MFFAFGGEISRSMESLRTTAPRNPFVQSNKVTVFFLLQASAPLSHWRWCVSRWKEWSRARRQSGLNTTTAGPLLVPVPALWFCLWQVSPSWSYPCLTCPGTHGRLAWTLSQSKWSNGDMKMNARVRRQWLWVKAQLWVKRARTGNLTSYQQSMALWWGFKPPTIQQPEQNPCVYEI